MLRRRLWLALRVSSQTAAARQSTQARATASTASAWLCAMQQLLTSCSPCRKLHADIFSGPVCRSPGPYTRNTVDQCASACNTGHACIRAPVFHTFDLPKVPKVLDAHAAAAILRIHHAPIRTKPQRRLIVSVHGCSTIARSAADEDGPRSEVVLVNSIIGCSLQAAHASVCTQGAPLHARGGRGALQNDMRPSRTSRSTRLTGRTLIWQGTAVPMAPSASTSTGHRPLASFNTPA